MNYDYHARDMIEQEILGSIMFHSKFMSLEEMKSLVLTKHNLDNPDYFATKMNQDIFTAVLKCWENDVSSTVELLMTFRTTNTSSEEDYFFLNVSSYATRFMGTIEVFENTLSVFKDYVIIDFWNKKANDILNNNWDAREVTLVGDNITSEYNLIKNRLKNSANLESSRDIISEAVLQRQKALSGEMLYIPTGIHQLDNKIKGWWPKEFSVIGARPSMGKSAVMIACAVHSGINCKIPTAFFSLEMDKIRLMNHIIAARLKIPYEDIKLNKVTDEQFAKILEYYEWFDKHSQLKIIDFFDVQNLNDILSILSTKQFKVAFVDYLQLVKIDKKVSRPGNREQEIAEISRALKLSTGMNDLALIAGAQLSRSVDTRGNGGRPQLSDLRESGAIEQDADNVYFPYRPAYYEEVANPNTDIPLWRKGNFEMRGAKGRDTGTVSVEFNLDLVTYKFREGMLHAEPPPEFSVGNG